jgi:D-alanyl-lipoteichoic acid acyltransferase DltB (MBOAT superfamily)
MIVPSLVFLAFATVAAIAHGLFASVRWRLAVLFVVNIAFLLSFSHDPRELAPYLAFLLVGYGLIRLIGRGIGGVGLAGCVAVILLFYAWLKQYGFFPHDLFLSFNYATVGLSYVFFRVLSLAVAAHDEPEMARVGPVQYINYTLNFTSLTSGPIQEYDEYKRMTQDEPAPLTFDDAGRAIERIVEGMFKFFVLATLVSLLQRELAGALLDTTLTPLHRIVLVTALTAAYPVFLFFNFAGYTSFVIGVARFFRIELPENFNHPFRAASFIDYWNRWHMSLSNWLKIHVYNPVLLACARRVTKPGMLPLLNAGALFLTFFLIGVWHGRAWHFFFFGLLNGGGVAVNQFYRLRMQRQLGSAKFLKLSTSAAYEFIGRGVTFAWVAFTLLWFWSDWPELGSLAKPLGWSGVVAGAAILIVAACLVLGLLRVIQELALKVVVAGQPLVTSRYVRTVWITIMLLSIIAINVVISDDTGHVVYKDF